MLTRRAFMERAGLPAAAAGAALLNPSWIVRVADASAARAGTPDETAADESFWFGVQQAYTVDRTLINLNNGGVSPAPRPVQESMKRSLDYSNTAPTYAMWRILEPQREGVRRQLASLFACDPGEIALTRNASEGLQILQQGFDLKPGDEVLATDQDYPRMIDTFKQMARRHGIVLKQFAIPTPCEDPEEIVRRYAAHITSNTKLMLISHVVFMTGQILPVNAVARLAREHGIPLLVDGAHSFAHFHFDNRDLDCDYFATSLHKWLGAPHGTGMLYIRKEKIADVWPLTPAPPSMDDDIRKFEEIGTHPAANYLAAGDAVAFYLGIGRDRKEARLRYLKNRWAERLSANGKVKLHTSLKAPFSCGFATMQVEGVDSAELVKHLWDKHRIIVVHIKHSDFEGVRVSPNVYTKIEEIDYFCEVMESIIRKGLPKA